MTDQAISDMRGAVALPRQNGELLFDEPWESRAFGLAVALTANGAYPWEDFRAGLIDEIEHWERDQKSDRVAAEPVEQDWCYYRHWLTSLERVLLERGVVSADELAERERTLAASDDHDHDHGHAPDDDQDHAHETREVTA